MDVCFNLVFLFKIQDLIWKVVPSGTPTSGNLLIDVLFVLIKVMFLAGELDINL